MLLDRLIGVFILDADAFEEIEANTNATLQAAVVVAVVAVLTSFGSSVETTNFAGGFLTTLVWALASWFIWAGLTYFIGTSLFDGKSDLGQMLRVLGFAQAPLILGVFGFVDPIGPLIDFAGGVWSLIAGFIAVRQGLDLENSQALITVVAGWIVFWIGRAVIYTFVL